MGRDGKRKKKTGLVLTFRVKGYWWWAQDRKALACACSAGRCTAEHSSVGAIEKSMPPAGQFYSARLDPARQVQ
mgnify:CR=1